MGKKRLCGRGKSRYDRLCRAARAPHPTPPPPHPRDHSSMPYSASIVRPPPFLLPFGGDFFLSNYRLQPLSCVPWSLTKYSPAATILSDPPFLSLRVPTAENNTVAPAPPNPSVCSVATGGRLTIAAVPWSGPCRVVRRDARPARQPAGCLLPLASVFFCCSGGT